MIMEVTGTVTQASHRRTSYGCTHASVLIARPGTHDVRLRYLTDFTPRVRRGQRITIEGMPMIGFPRVNIGGVTVTIHDQED